MQQMDNIKTGEFSFYWSWIKIYNNFLKYTTILWDNEEQSTIRHKRHRHLRCYSNQLNICLDRSPTDVKFQYLLKFNIC